MMGRQGSFSHQPGPVHPAARVDAGRPDAQPLVAHSDLDRIICGGVAETLVICAEKVGTTLARQELKTHQIRSFFGAVRHMEMDWLRGPEDGARATKAQRQLRLLQPRLAYQAKRIKERIDGKEVFPVETLRGVLSPAITMVLSQPQENRRDCFSHFVEFFEAIIAYHRACGGTD